LTWPMKNFFHFLPAKAANCPNKTKAEYLMLSFSCGFPLTEQQSQVNTERQLQPNTSWHHSWV
jgi:hypothetical protein